MRKDNMTMDEYISKAKDLFNTLFVIGNNIIIREKIMYLLDGLNSDYNALVTKLTSKKNMSPLEEVFTMMKIHE